MTTRTLSIMWRFTPADTSSDISKVSSRLMSVRKRSLYRQVHTRAQQLLHMSYATTRSLRLHIYFFSVPRSSSVHIFLGQFVSNLSRWSNSILTKYYIQVCAIQHFSARSPYSIIYMRTSHRHRCIRFTLTTYYWKFQYKSFWATVAAT